jgi:UDP-N-acetylmuramoyl-L-alanyl-D-glutamate--2,6-diaminopimelate ligase
MGKISAQLSDITILTAEDPRTEDVNKIIDQISEGCLKSEAKELPSPSLRGPRHLEKVAGDVAIPSGKQTPHLFTRIPDRQQAITYAISKLAHKGDTILITGKGHEQSMCCGTVETPWSDHQAVQKALKVKNR